MHTIKSLKQSPQLKVRFSDKIESMCPFLGHMLFCFQFNSDHCDFEISHQKFEINKEKIEISSLNFEIKGQKFEIKIESSVFCKIQTNIG